MWCLIRTRARCLWSLAGRTARPPAYGYTPTAIQLPAPTASVADPSPTVTEMGAAAFHLFRHQPVMALSDKETHVSSRCCQYWNLKESGKIGSAPLTNGHRPIESPAAELGFLLSEPAV